MGSMLKAGLPGIGTAEVLGAMNGIMLYGGGSAGLGLALKLDPPLRISQKA
jgi:hypothetical protein